MLGQFLKWFVGALWGAQNNVFSQIDTLVPAVPSSVSDGCASLSAVVSWVKPVSWFIPLDYVAVAFGIVALCLAASVLIKITRIMASFATVGGGSAG